MTLAARVGVTRLAASVHDRGYRVAWGAAALAVLAAAASGVLVGDPVVVCSLFLTTLASAWCVALAAMLEQEVRMRAALAPSVTVAAVVTGAYAGYVVAGAWAVVLLVLVVATAPRVVLLAAGAAGGRTDGPPSLAELVAAAAWSDVEAADAAPPVTPRSPTDVATLSTRRLCDLWMATTDELGRHPTARGWLALVDLRAACLAELWRRDEAGCRRWCRAGALQLDPRAWLRAGSADGDR